VFERGVEHKGGLALVGTPRKAHRALRQNERPFKGFVKALQRPFKGLLKAF